MDFYIIICEQTYNITCQHRNTYILLSSLKSFRILCYTVSAKPELLALMLNSKQVIIKNYTTGEVSVFKKDSGGRHIAVGFFTSRDTWL